MKTTNSSKLDRLLETFLKFESSQLNQQQISTLTKKSLLTNSDFVLLFSITPKTAYNWRNRNLVESIKISTRIYYSWVSVMKLLKFKMENTHLFK